MAVFALDRRSEEASCGERGSADSSLTNHADVEAALGGGGSTGEADEPTPNDENVGRLRTGVYRHADKLAL